MYGLRRNARKMVNKMEIVGLTEKNVEKISKIKKESKFFTDFRLNSYKVFKDIEDPSFGPGYDINFDEIIYYKSNDDTLSNDWNKISCSIRNELGDLGVIDSEKKMDGLGVQYESEMIYHNMIEELNKKNVIFTSIDEAIKNYPDLVKKYFGKIVKSTDNKFAALNGCVFSGGSFIYIPPHTTLDRPLQSYFRINSKKMGQFERSLIIVDDDSHLHYIEGCTAPEYTESSLHAAVVEIYVGKNSSCRYSTVQNWSNNVYNLVTKRAMVDENGTMEWIDGNIGSKTTMKYPACILKGDNSSGTCITISVAGKGQEQDTGARMIHLGKNTKSKIISNSIAKNGGNATYRGKVDIKATATNSESLVKCDSLILDELSKSDTYPVNINENETSNIIHEATVSKISEDNLMYLMTRGISKEKATELIILGFIDKFKQELPMEYAVELNQLIKRVL
jgi:Fe-S cluster assembly protein SufB